MPIPVIIQRTQTAMSKAVEHCQHELTKIRTGRASAALLDQVRVDYYGTPTPLSQIAQISVPDARSLVVQPWERNMLGEIDKAIRSAGLGLNPSNDGVVVRVPVPPLTEDRRKDLVKMCKKAGEDGRIMIRNIRRDEMEALKKAEKDEKFSEDDRKRGEADIQNLTNKFIKNIDEILVKKEQEVMAI